MNYGPLVKAIDELVRAKISRYACKNHELFYEHDKEVSRAAIAVARAQDQFFDDVKGGRIDKGD